MSQLNYATKHPLLKGCITNLSSLLTVLNADLHERFGRTTMTPAADHFTAAVPPPQHSTRYINQIQEYVDAANQPVNTDSWLSQPEIPTAAEILDLPEQPYGDSKINDTSVAGDECVIDLDINNVSGPWESKEKYLSAHYELLREDSVRPLREAVAQVKANPSAGEDEFGGSVGIYERVGVFNRKTWDDLTFAFRCRQPESSLLSAASLFESFSPLREPAKRSTGRSPRD